MRASESIVPPSAAMDVPAVKPTATTKSLGKYQLFASIGTGGMAEVFLAVARGPMGFNKLSVVKRLRANLASESTDFVAMFMDEARLAARLSHPNIVHTYDVGTENGSFYIAMEYLDGQSLHRISRAVAKRGERVPIPVAVRIAAEALAGLHYSHELRDYNGTPLCIIHRDVSPQNVFVAYDGQVKILDFGIAKATLNSTSTETGAFKGKPGYMSPEQTTIGAYDRRVDVFAMGVVLWEMITGERLFPGDAVQALMSVTSGPIPKASTLRPEIDSALSDVIEKALKRNPDERYLTAEQMRLALEQWLSSQPKPVTTAEVSGFVSGLFKDVRETLRARIEEKMAEVVSAPTDSDTSSDITVQLDTGLLEIASGPSGLRVASDKSRKGSDSSSGKLHAGLFEQPPTGNKRFLFVVVPLALAVIGLLAIVMRRPSSPSASGVAPPVSSTTPASRPAGVRATLFSDPLGASVQWNDHMVGITPTTVDLPPGSQVLVYSKVGFENATLTVEIAPDEVEPIVRTVALAPLKQDSVAVAVPRGGGSRYVPPVAHPGPVASSAPPPASAGLSPSPGPAATPTVTATRRTVRVIGDDAVKVKVLDQQ